MLVYKFGGASIASAQGVRNLIDIVSRCSEELVVVVSAMGKVTNSLERVTTKTFELDKHGALVELEICTEYHRGILVDLDITPTIADVWAEKLKQTVDNYNGYDYDRLYDEVVSQGEMLSSRIVYEAMQAQRGNCKLLDMREIFICTNQHRGADVDIKISKHLLRAATNGAQVYIAQGFIGANEHDAPVTLGREGSDYSASLVGAILGATSVTIWKDVPGVMNCDPRLFDDAQLIEHLSYKDAVELSFSGAQIIHPKSIKPLTAKNIPLYVKPFGSPSSMGSCINSTPSNISLPIIIVKSSQRLLTIRPRDFSFAAAEALPDVLLLLKEHRQKINMVQSSAISITLSLDESRYFDALIEQLKEDYIVRYNSGLSLITIRGYSDELIQKHTHGKIVYARQQTRRAFRAVIGSEV